MPKKKVDCNFRDDGDCIIKLAQNFVEVSQKCDGEGCIFQKILSFGKK